MATESDVFITKFGKKIAKWPGFLESHDRRNPNPKGYLEFNKQSPDASLRVGFHSFLYDYYTYTMSMEFLENIGLGGPFDRALDIGGREATVSRLLRAEKRAQSSSCVEILDFSKMLTEELFIKFFSQLKGFSALRKNMPALDDQLLQTHSSNFGYYPSEKSLFWNLELQDQPVLNNYYIEDIYQHDEQYDLVTAFLCLDYFNPVHLFKKVFDLLESGGVFYFIYRYWWYPVNSTLIVGEFPYACQRLCREDLFRYFDESIPGKNIEPLYNYFHQGAMQPVLDDLIEMGNQSGLRHVCSRRLTPQALRDSSTQYSPTRLLQEHVETLNEVLDDIRCFRSDVRLSDLQTKYAMAAFVKP